MIIHGLTAENLLKYRRLELSGLPEQGVIAVGGQNESGKSSIGESICFALFGRTFAVAPEHLEKLIRWGETSCSVDLELSVADGVRYSISRSLDRAGSHAARLCRAEDPDDPIALGVEAVAEALQAILGYDFEVFIDSFYLAQREITAPHPHSHSVKIMAGIAPLEQCREEFQQELARDREVVERSGRRLEETDAQLQEVGFDPELLAALEQERDQASELVAGAHSCRQSLNSVAADYRERSGRLRSTRRGRKIANALRWPLLLLTAASLGAWELLSRAPESEAGRWLEGLLSATPSGWQPGQESWLLYGGAGLGVLCILFWVRAVLLGRRIRRQQGAERQLRQELRPLDEMEALLAGPLPGADAVEEAGEERQRPPPEVRVQVLERAAAGSAEADEVFDLVGKESWWLDRALERLRRRIEALEEQIAGQQREREEHDRLSAERSGLELQAREHRHLIRLRELADGLLLGAAGHLSHRFNYNLRGLVGETLPLLTEGRYQHLQIDDNLTVQAFSADKRGFMDLAEISSGTQRQIMLALRLALSRELVKRAVNSNQFLFLDEPFAFFDEERTRSALEVLPSLSDDITQIWVVAQQFPEGVSFARQLHCDRDGDSCISSD